MTYINILVMSLCGFFPPEAGSDFVLAQAETNPPAAVALDVGEGKTTDPVTTSTDTQGTPAEGVDTAASGDGDAAEEEAAASETGGFWSVIDDLLHTGGMGLMIEGGIFMWPILLMGIVAFAVIIERFRSLKMLSTDTQALRSQVRTLLEQDRVEEALHLCDGLQGPVPAILSAGLRKFLVLQRLEYDPGKIEEQVVKAMDDYGIHVVAALDRHLPNLATVASAAPMVGFLGTVSGMVNSFQNIVATMGETNIVEAAAGGISEALLTTALGLIVGIPAYVAFNYFTSVINRFVLEVEESATELIETVTLQMALRRRETEESKVDEIAAR
ncbi:MAG: MotA/TolQ/ExbB proton channel family protein [Planctomycetaceae bacterium]